MILMEVSKYYWNVEFPKISIKIEKFKTFYESQTAICPKEIIQAPTRLEFPTSLEQLFPNGDLQEYIDICFPSAPRMQFLGV